MERETRIANAKKHIRDRAAYRVFILVLLLGICVLGFLVSVSVGALRISIPQVLTSIFLEKDGINRQIIWNIRTPRTIVGGLVGLCLSLSGVVLQGVTRNPLAAPNIIGVSSGAAVAAMTVTIALPKLFYLVTPAAFIGAFVTTVLIYLLAWKNGVRPMRLILAGVAVSAFLGALTNALMTFFPERVQGIVGFLVGGLSARTWRHFNTLWPYAVGGFVLVNLFSGRLNLLSLGDDTAKGLGLHVERVRMVLIAAASLLAASAVSVAGLLGFVGLIAPHMARLIIGSDFRYLVPASALFGAALVIVCDIPARMLFDPVEIPVGIIMAVLGAPFFLYLLRGGIRHES